MRRHRSVASSWAVSARSAFTLIEMMVVVTILIIAMAMVTMLPRDNVGMKVEQAARELQTVLMKAQSLAKATGDVHAVTFHLRNAGTGAVFRNRHDPLEGDERGGHWYALIGPDGGGDSTFTEHPPKLGANTGVSGLDYKSITTINEFVAAMQRSQIGDIHYLPAGVRFLAFSDMDYGQKQRERASWMSNGETYPRPWYGYFDADEGRLYPWCGYDPDLDAAIDSGRSVTGFCFEGDDGAIPYDADLDCRVNPPEVYGRFSDMTQPAYDGQGGSKETGLAGKPRPVFNAYWADCAIYFYPDGRALMLYGHIRPSFLDRFYPQNLDHRAAFLLDNELAITGGYHITLAPDIDPLDPMYQVDDTVSGGPAFDRFASAEDALRSLKPLARVFVGRDTATVEVKSKEHPDCRLTVGDLSSKEAYPQ